MTHSLLNLKDGEFFPVFISVGKAKAQIHRLETTGICFGPSTFAGAAISPLVGLSISDLEAAKPLDNPGRSFSASERSKKPAPL
jgi:hypothetical protein